MSDDAMQTTTAKEEGAGKIVALVVAFLMMPVPIYLLGRSGYTYGRAEVTFMGLSFFGSLVLGGFGFFTVGLQSIFVYFARRSTRSIVRALAFFTFFIVIAFGMGSCVGGCVWGDKVNKREWSEPPFHF